ncbi:hypothetical protein SEA_APHELION_61 [Gordonia phage Aphelion]|uniref:Uncharacterized protein n=1 Tax=Gordonia phage Aphelion TaxID=2507860 RepID=A0A410TD27_9CAUD|nr:hypothetical protein SEA_APHELION_61 [Gordonia phage Aphelion]QYC53546.1 membrane protein [Gordonia phage Norvs]
MWCDLNNASMQRVDRQTRQLEIRIPRWVVYCLTGVVVVAAVAGLVGLVFNVVGDDEPKVEPPAYVADCGQNCSEIYVRLQDACTGAITDCVDDATWMESRTRSIRTPYGILGDRPTDAWTKFRVACGREGAEWESGSHSIPKISGTGDCRWIADTAIRLTELNLEGMQLKEGSGHG